MIIYQIIAFLFAITIHEAAHAWMAYRLGDPTAKLQKRTSLNPINHMDLYGTVLIPFFLIVIGSPFVFGWAKPVIFDPYNLKDPRRDSALISLAGPMVNIISAVVFAAIIHLNLNPFSVVNWLFPLLSYLVIINLVLALFNLIPIHPLDGGKVLVGILPKKDAYELDKFLRRYGTLILIFIIFPVWRGISPISVFLNPVMRFLLSILLPGTNLI